MYKTPVVDSGGKKNKDLLFCFGGCLLWDDNFLLLLGYLKLVKILDELENALLQSWKQQTPLDLRPSRMSSTLKNATYTLMQQL